jgi:hypothetical protein
VSRLSDCAAGPPQPGESALKVPQGPARLRRVIGRYEIDHAAHRVDHGVHPALGIEGIYGNTHPSDLILDGDRVSPGGQDKIGVDGQNSLDGRIDDSANDMNSSDFWGKVAVSRYTNDPFPSDPDCEEHFGQIRGQGDNSSGGCADLNTVAHRIFIGCFRYCQ